jgi:hypothetical protein
LTATSRSRSPAPKSPLKSKRTANASRASQTTATRGAGSGPSWDGLTTQSGTGGVDAVSHDRAHDHERPGSRPRGTPASRAWAWSTSFRWHLTAPHVRCHPTTQQSH